MERNPLSIQIHTKWGEKMLISVTRFAYGSNSPTSLQVDCSNGRGGSGRCLVGNTGFCLTLSHWGGTPATFESSVGTVSPNEHRAEGGWFFDINSKVSAFHSFCRLCNLRAIQSSLPRQTMSKRDDKMGPTIQGHGYCHVHDRGSAPCRVSYGRDRKLVQQSLDKWW